MGKWEELRINFGRMKTFIGKKHYGIMISIPHNNNIMEELKTLDDKNILWKNDKHW